MKCNHTTILLNGAKEQNKYNYNILGFVYRIFASILLICGSCFFVTPTAFVTEQPKTINYHTLDEGKGQNTSDQKNTKQQDSSILEDGDRIKCESYNNQHRTTLYIKNIQRITLFDKKTKKKTSLVAKGWFSSSKNGQKLIFETKQLIVIFK